MAVRARPDAAPCLVASAGAAARGPAHTTDARRHFASHVRTSSSCLLSRMLFVRGSSVAGAPAAAGHLQGMASRPRTIFRLARSYRPSRAGPAAARRRKRWCPRRAASASSRTTSPRWRRRCPTPACWPRPPPAGRCRRCRKPVVLGAAGEGGAASTRSVRPPRHWIENCMATAVRSDAATTRWRWRPACSRAERSVSLTIQLSAAGGRLGRETRRSRQRRRRDVLRGVSPGIPAVRHEPATSRRASLSIDIRRCPAPARRRLSRRERESKAERGDALIAVPAVLRPLACKPFLGRREAGEAGH